MTLVTVGICTFNSSKYILETLESIRSQSYESLELIISDDVSKDNTLEKVYDWVKKIITEKRFKRVLVLEADENRGPAANANRILDKANGEWIKYLGADDTLLPDCLESNIQFIRSNPEIKVLFSKVNIYSDTFESRNYIKTTPIGDFSPESILWPERTADSQNKMLLVSDRIHFTPSIFINREALLQVGGFDERFSMMEDYPLWLNLTRNGYKLFFLDKVTVNYRRHSGAIYNTGMEFLINPSYFSRERFRRIYTYPNLPRVIRLDQRFKWIVSQVFRLKLLNRKRKLNKYLYYLLSIYINPFKYYIWCKKQFARNLENNEFYD